LLESEFNVIGSVENGQRVLELAPSLSPDILVLDIGMPFLNGIEAAARLRQSGSLTKVVFLTANDDLDFVDAARSVGALGYVLKSRAAADLTLAIHAALEGREFVSPSLTSIH
jgi:DNA-binding NarL/FixJ family response regulator